MFKLGSFDGRDWSQHSHPPVFEIVERPSGAKVVATAPGGDPLVIERLSRCLEPPYLLLYVLHTPRGEGEPGRYQSPDLSAADLGAFLRRFSGFLQADARFDLWVHAPADEATIVWDRHDLIHAYGAADRFVEALRALGFEPGTPAIPSPHQHGYHPALDGDARDLLAWTGWTRTPLRSEDEQ